MFTNLLSVAGHICHYMNKKQKICCMQYSQNKWETEVCLGSCQMKPYMCIQSSLDHETMSHKLLALFIENSVFHDVG